MNENKNNPSRLRAHSHNCPRLACIHVAPGPNGPEHGYVSHICHHIVWEHVLCSPHGFMSSRTFLYYCQLLRPSLGGPFVFYSVVSEYLCQVLSKIYFAPLYNTCYTDVKIVGQINNKKRKTLSQVGIACYRTLLVTFTDSRGWL